MECRTLEITLISAKDLKDVNRFSTMDVYAELSIHGDAYNSKQKQKSPVNKDGGTDPKWNHTFKFTIHESSAQDNRLTLQIKLISDRSLGDKEIGEIHVPIKELLDNKAGDGIVSYSVRLPNGKNKGTVNFSFKFGEKFEAPMKQEKAKHVDHPVMAYPPAPAGYPGAGGSSGYPAPGGYPPPQGQNPYSYPYPPPGGYPPPPPQHAYGGYPAAPGYGYGGYPAQPGYGGYPQVVQKPQKPKKSGMGMGLGLGAGLLGGLLVGDMISDVGDMDAYDAGFDDGGFDF
ncbi:protein SRC2 homolog [Euphorbia lathyris]|uniref:protein SRC2 homolog n=1 Tax=Euphorbia lathyris TaxID=212925 RepID=UPI003313C94A